MLLMATFLPRQAKAQETLTVCDGKAPGTTTSTNSFIPIYGSYVDTQGTTSEFIIPATTEGMDALEGGEISKLTFYISNNPATWGSPVIQIYMGEVEGTTLSSINGPTNLTVVYEGVLSNTQAAMEIELNEPYTYEGGNLLIGTYVKTKSDTYKATSFSGISAPSGSSRYKSSSYGSGTAQSFLPMTTFTYTAAAGGCAKPSSVAPADITSNSATINWTGESDNYNVQYKKKTETAWTDRATNYSGTSIGLTGLEANTEYQVQVQSICEGNITSGWKGISFETPCQAESTFPFYENFNSLTTSGEIPGCWDNDEGTTTNANYKWSYYATGHEGKCIRFNSYSNSYNTNFLKTVPMNLPAGKTMQLRFWYKNPTGGDFSIYISTDGGTTHTAVLKEHLANRTDWTEEEIVLGKYVGQSNVAIVFKGTSNNGSGDAYIYLDDVFVEEAPTCPKQSGLQYTDVTSSSVTLDWTAGTNEQDHWDVFITDDVTVIPNANTTPTVVNTANKPYTHSGLTDGKTYYAFVRARCSDTDQSPWTTACRFTTPQTPIVIDGDHPYSNNFESECDWMFVNGDYINKWCYGSAANNTEGGSKAIYISNDNGVTNAYSTVKSVEYATKNFTFAEGVYTFSFDWRAKGNQYYDFIRVALVPSSVELVSTENAPFDKTSLPSGWIALDGGTGLNNNTSWQTVVADEISVPAGDYRMVVGWRNFAYGSDNQPPAAIDNVSISLLTCPRPTGLTASNITGRTATLSWTENSTATNWVLQYATNNAFTENLTETNVSETASIELTGLTPETKYYARVKSVLGTDESSWSDVKDFTTLATCPKPTLSYVTNSNTAYTGSVSWTGSIADAYEVAYRPKDDFDPSDLTLTDVTRIQLENVTEYTYTLQNLTPETKYYIYIQANCGAEDGVSQWSNRVTFYTLATCLAPSYLTDEEVTSTSVFLSWTKGAEDQDAWQFRYRKASTSEYTYVLVENNSSNSYELTGLEPATSYDVNVRAWCGGDDYSKWSLANQNLDKSITTACASITLPYTCDFEGAVETGGHFSTYSVPKCWSRIEMQYGSYSPYTYYPYVYDYSSNAHSGTKSLRMYRTPNSANQTIILPAIDDSYQMSDLQIRFWAKAGSSNNTLSVGIMDGESFTEVQSVEGVSTSYAEFTVPLTSYAGSGRNIAIKCGSSSTYLYYYIDDVTVEEIPSCLIPTGLTCTGVDVNSASFVWQPGKDETEWNIQYKKTSDSEWSNPIHVTELPTTENPFVLTGLQRGLEYEARIQAYCDAEDQSEWNSMPVSFTTDCGVWPIDAQNALFENFSGDAFPPACWDWIRVNNYTGWEHSTNVYDPVDPTGTAYSYWPNGDTYLILPHMHINGNAKLSFDMAFSSSGSGEESSVVLSTTGKTALNFSTTLWTATEFPTTKTNVSIDLSDYHGQDVYIAFKFAGVGTSGRMWYIDNVHVGKIFTKDITAYTEGSNDHYYLIASPIGNVNPENVENMLANSYDLYLFDQSQDLEWRNYKQGDGFELEPGKGYLYANSENVTLSFRGTPYNGDGKVSLVKDDNAEFAGWNLVGNPFAQTAYITKPFYKMNESGSSLGANTSTGAIEPMEGVFVIADNEGETLTFSTTKPTEQTSALMLDVVSNRSSSIDRAIISFSDEKPLPKFMLNPNSTKIYIPQSGQDYALVSSESIGELPINFKAQRNGTYTLNFNKENVEFDNLLLIDNLTGIETDLLESPSYSFVARTNDYASRFRLVFSANGSGGNSDASFAYYNGSEWIINASTNATLQVIDMTGRIILNTGAKQSISTANLKAGVYLIRLVDSNGVKTQKIVVE